MEYRAIYQTWTMVRPLSTSTASDAKETTHEESKTRHRFQRLRIAKRCSIASLAAILNVMLRHWLHMKEEMSYWIRKHVQVERCLSS